MEQEPSIPEEETADLGNVTTDETASVEAENQRLRELRYQKAVEREDSVEVRKTIDIFETPLFFRKEEGLLAFLEYERIGRMRARGKTLSRFASSPKEGLREQSIFLEAPIPYCQKRFLGGTILELVDTFQRIFPELDETSLAQLISESTRLAYQSESQDHAIDMEIAYEDIGHRQDFIKECLQNPEYQKIWLATQKYMMNRDKFRDRDSYIQLSSRTFGHGGSFLVNPENVDLFTVDDSQGHNDHALEILGVKDIPVKDLLGFLQIDKPYTTGNGDSRLTVTNNTKLIEVIPYEAAQIYGHRPNAKNYRFTPAGVRHSLNNLLEGTNSLSLFGSRRSSEDIQKAISEICKILSIDEDTFARQEAREKIETMPGVYGRYLGLHPNFPEIPTGELTLKEIEQEIFNRSLPRLKEFFPFQKFTAETVDQDIITALTKYITDRFDVDPEEITINDFIYRVVQSMGIPIYDREGNQLWPEERSYEDIHEQSQSKNE